MNRFVFIAFLAFCFVSSSPAASKIGDKAPALEIEHWVKGSPVKIDASKKIYVVEFWATWCTPCVQSMPHVSSLQEKYKDKGVVFVGITGEEKPVVNKFLKEMGSKVRYNIAIDKDNQTAVNYIAAFGLQGIPYAFIIQSGKILWVGHPMELDTPLLEVINGTFDLAAAIKLDELNRLANDFLQHSVNGDPETKELGDKLIVELADKPRVLAALAFETIANPRAPYRNFPFANAALDAAEKAPGKDLHFIKAVRSIVLFESGKTEEGLKLIDEAIAEAEHAPDIAQYNNFRSTMKARIEEVEKQQP